jgi:hypothetical protein
MMPEVQTIADVVAAVASLTAVAIAIFALRLAAQTFRRDHRPIVRVVALIPAGQENALDLNSVLLKNIGRGPALTGIAAASDGVLIGDIEAVEPLGDADDEAHRPGRVKMDLALPMTMNTTYDLYYQDVLGHWHLTRFRPVPFRIECSFVGKVRRHKVPGSVLSWGTVARP